MAVKIQPTSVIKAHLGIEPRGPVQKFFTNSCYKHMNKYVPKREGTLRTVVDIKADSITYEQEYASYQYYGQREDGTRKINPKNYTTLGTGPYWDKRMWSAERQDVIDEVQRYVNRGGF